MSKDTVPVDLPRELLREVITRLGHPMPINDRALTERAAEAVAEALRLWLGRR
jgi:hypothetical protein